MVRDRVGESLVLDYKESRALAREGNAPNELAKDVSAFANSDGGRLIYGVKEEDSFPVDFDEGVDHSRIGREWILDTIYGKVRPRLEGLKAYPVEHPRTPGRVLYVIEVEKARTAHMANRSYYKRFELQSVPMDDYEVRDVMRRSEAPDVRVRLVNHPSAAREVFIEVRNQSPTPAAYFSVSFLFSPGINIARADGIFRAGTIKFGGVPRDVIVAGREAPFSEWRYEWWDRMPLFEADWERLALLELETPPESSMLWYAEGPGMRNQGAYKVPSDVVPYRLKPADDLIWRLASR
jgi:hypothetical protein